LALFFPQCMGTQNDFTHFWLTLLLFKTDEHLWLTASFVTGGSEICHTNFTFTEFISVFLNNSRRLQIIEKKSHFSTKVTDESIPYNILNSKMWNKPFQ
jgi:hypothetical protein